EWPTLRHRRPDHATPRLCGEPAEEKAHRGAVRMGQDHRRSRTTNVTRGPKARLQVHPYNGRIQSHPPAQADRGDNMTCRPNTKPFEKPIDHIRQPSSSSLSKSNPV